MTGRDLITGSLRLIGARGPGETMAASEAAEGLAALNALIDSWSNENLLIHAITQESPLMLTPGDSTVTLGTSGDIATRPMKIEAAVIRDSIDYPVNVHLSLAEFVAIQVKSLQNTYPTDLYDDGGYPLRTLTLYPVPSAAKSLILFTGRPLSSITTLDTSIALPQGYERALKYNLAVDLAPEYGKQTPPEVLKVAEESKATIKRSNHKPRYLACDPALVTNGRPNILAGDTR